MSVLFFHKHRKNIPTNSGFMNPDGMSLFISYYKTEEPRLRCQEPSQHPHLLSGNLLTPYNHTYPCPQAHSRRNRHSCQLVQTYSSDLHFPDWRQNHLCLSHKGNYRHRHLLSLGQNLPGSIVGDINQIIIKSHLIHRAKQCVVARLQWQKRDILDIFRNIRPYLRLAAFNSPVNCERYGGSDLRRPSQRMVDTLRQINPWTRLRIHGRISMSCRRGMKP